MHPPALKLPPTDSKRLSEGCRVEVEPWNTEQISQTGWKTRWLAGKFLLLKYWCMKRCWDQIPVLNKSSWSENISDPTAVDKWPNHSSTQKNNMCKDKQRHVTFIHCIQNRLKGILQPEVEDPPLTQEINTANPLGYPPSSSPATDKSSVFPPSSAKRHFFLKGWEVKWKTFPGDSKCDRLCQRAQQLETRHSGGSVVGRWVPLSHLQQRSLVTRAKREVYWSDRLCPWMEPTAWN